MTDKIQRLIQYEIRIIILMVHVFESLSLCACNFYISFRFSELKIKASLRSVSDSHSEQLSINIFDNRRVKFDQRNEPRSYDVYLRLFEKKSTFFTNITKMTVIICERILFDAIISFTFTI